MIRSLARNAFLNHIILSSAGFFEEFGRADFGRLAQNFIEDSVNRSTALSLMLYRNAGTFAGAFCGLLAPASVRGHKKRRSYGTRRLALPQAGLKS
jgi:hypothetical protein